MPSLRSMLKYYLDRVEARLRQRRLCLQPNLLGAEVFPPGHFYSPLLDLQSLEPNAAHLPFDGPEFWEHIDLRPEHQRAYYLDLLHNFPLPAFPKQKTPPYRYFTENLWFVLSDAFTLSAIIRKEKPRLIIEVGSGFSSAVMLDTLNHAQQRAALTFIEPFPERLLSLLSPEDKASASILQHNVQLIDLATFDQLQPQDILFIDSSHVAKIGSDVTFLLLRVLPRLKPGVLVHFHDIFYPFTYPVDWIRRGWAWNESLFLRAFLAGNPNFQILAFNSFAGHSFPDLFHQPFPAFLQNTGGSFWLKKLTN